MAVPLLTMEETKLVQSLYDAIRYEAGKSNVCKSGCTVNTSTLPKKIDDIVTNLSKQGKCGLGHKQYYVFETCEELGQFGGTCDCALQKGDIAIVIDMNGKPAIFMLTDSFSSSDVGACPNDGEVTSATCARLKWVTISSSGDKYLTSADLTGNTLNLKMNDGQNIPVTLPASQDTRVVSANVQGNMLHIVMNQGGDITTALPSSPDIHAVSANMQGNTLHIVMNSGADITVAIPQQSAFVPTAYNSSQPIKTTYSPDSIVKVKESNGTYFKYVIPSTGFYNIQSSMMLSYINPNASQHELDYLSLSHYQYIYRNSSHIAQSHIGLGVMSKCNPRAMVSGDVHYSGKFNSGDTIYIKKKTRKCNTTPAVSTLSGYLNITITKLG